MPDPKRAQVLDAIRRALEPVNDVRAAILFGSHATGSIRPDSDIDVAVLLAADSHQQSTHDGLLRGLIVALSHELAADRLDVIILNTAPPALAFQALKHGSVALERDPRDLHRFRVRTYSTHADYAHVERFFRAVTKQRALAGLNRG
jgi:predicted nucleotidyltransferase